MKFTITKKWLDKAVALEDGANVSAGRPRPTMTAAPLVFSGLPRGNRYQVTGCPGIIYMKVDQLYTLRTNERGAHSLKLVNSVIVSTAPVRDDSIGELVFTGPGVRVVSDGRA